MQVPQSTAVLPPAFSAMLPPMVQAQALVGSVAKTRPRPAACSMALSVMTPASSRITVSARAAPPRERELALLDAADPVQLLGVDDDAAGAQRDRAAGEAGAGAARDRLAARALDGRQQRRHLRLGRSASTTASGQVEPPVGGVGGVGDQREGVEEDVVLARRLARARRRCGRARPGAVATSRRKPLDQRAGRLEHLEDQRVAARRAPRPRRGRSPGSRRGAGGASSRCTSSSTRYGLRRWTSTSPKTRISRRAERPVTRRARSSSSFAQTSSPSRWTTACRSSAEV